MKLIPGKLYRAEKEILFMPEGDGSLAVIEPGAVLLYIGEDTNKFSERYLRFLGPKGRTVYTYPIFRDDGDVYIFGLERIDL